MTEETPKVKSPFLAEVLSRKRAEVAEMRASRPVAEVRALASDLSPVRPWDSSLRTEGTAVIAEIKRRSPSAGRLDAGVDPAEQARVYARAGAAAISVVTDAAFDGAIDDLKAASRAVEVPILQKDFLIDPWQIWESRAAGADAVLLIVAALDRSQLVELAGTAREAGLGLLVEVHTEAEAERAVEIAPRVIGVNSRDLRSLRVSVKEARRVLAGLRKSLGDSVVLVAESGVRTPDDVRRASRAGADAVLVGEHLMRSERPGEALATLVEAGGTG